ncbi:hypothetical protein M3J09_005703 [Ascochyta lentis]
MMAKVLVSDATAMSSLVPDVCCVDLCTHFGGAPAYEHFSFNPFNKSRSAISSRDSAFFKSICNLKCRLLVAYSSNPLGTGTTRPLASQLYSRRMGQPVETVSARQTTMADGSRDTLQRADY